MGAASLAVGNSEGLKFSVRVGIDLGQIKNPRDSDHGGMAKAIPLG